LHRELCCSGGVPFSVGLRQPIEDKKEVLDWRLALLFYFALLMYMFITGQMANSAIPFLSICG
jgi:hypothetical protein